MHILIAYFSYTTGVETLARRIEAQLREEHEVTVTPIEPVRSRSYWNWLVRSCLPGSRVATKPVATRLEQFDRICLGFPKWTLSCPPLNDYLSRLPEGHLVPFGLFMAFGGFDEDRYLRALVRGVARRGSVAVTLAVKRRLIRSPRALSAIDSFCRTLVAPVSRTVELKVDLPE
jgi:hypothetical protein